MTSIFSSNGVMVYQRDADVRVEVQPGKPARVLAWRNGAWLKMLNRSWKKIVEEIVAEVRQ